MRPLDRLFHRQLDRLDVALVEGGVEANLPDGSVRILGCRADGPVAQVTIASGQGTAGKLLTDQTLYDQLNKLVLDLGAILADIRKDPSKYMKGVIKVF